MKRYANQGKTCTFCIYPIDNDEIDDVEMKRLRQIWLDYAEQGITLLPLLGEKHWGNKQENTSSFILAGRLSLFFFLTVQFCSLFVIKIVDDT